MNDDDKSFFSKIKNGSQSTNDIFITLKPNSQLSFTGDTKMPDQLKGFLPSSHKIRSAAIFRIPSLHCDILYATPVRLPIEKLAGFMSEYYEQSRKQFHGMVKSKLDNLLRFYLKVMKNYCAKTEEDGDEDLKRWHALDEKYKIFYALYYLERDRGGLGLTSGNSHVDALQLLLKAHKVIGPYWIGAYDDKYPAPKTYGKAMADLDTQIPPGDTLDFPLDNS